MSFYTKLGALAYVYDKLKEVYEWGEIAINATDPEVRDQAAIEAATKLAEAVGVGIPLWYLDKVLEKTGLDRVFDSLKKQQSFQDYLKRQEASKAIRGATLGTLADWGLAELREWINENRALDPIFDGVKDFFNNAKRWQPGRDPLTFDLDGDGLETVGVNTVNPVLFDHDGDGVKSSTGWVKPDDGFLVFDRNNNGLIDSGAELFGDATLISGGSGKAADGFAALAFEDTNKDGKIDDQDANWTELYVWRDLNQDAVSQTNELFTLNSLNIASIQVAKTEHSVFLTNGNEIADLGQYTKKDGTTGALGEVGQVADINLAIDTFTTKFTDHIPLAQGVDVLPNHSGSGQVRTLREAASIDSDAGRNLRSKLEAFAAATTGSQQRALLVDLIVAWGATSQMLTSVQLDTRETWFRPWKSFGNVFVPEPPGYQSHSGITVLQQFRVGAPENFNRFNALEQFNGSNILINQVQVDIFLSTNGDLIHTLNIESDRADLLTSAWNSLVESIYPSLIFQTRFRPVIELIDLVVDVKGVHYDYSRLDAYFAQRTANGSVDGLIDLIEFTKYIAPKIEIDADWGGFELVDQLVRNTPLDATLIDFYREVGVSTNPTLPGKYVGTDKVDIIIAGNSNDTIFGKNGNDVLSGGDGADTIDGGVGNDVLFGGVGNDKLFGGDGEDLLRDDLGDDILNSGEGNDVLYGGDGVDTIDAGNGDDILVGGDGDDKLYGGGGSDDLNGGSGVDFLDGGSGNDNLIGGAGEDFLDGGNESALQNKQEPILARDYVQ